MSNGYKKVDQKVIKILGEMVGEKNLVVEREKLINYTHDEITYSEFFTFPEVVVKPENTQQVSEILKFCSEEKIPVTPRGGGTGLAGGCIPLFGGIVLSLEKMKKVIEIDTENFTVTVESGIPLMEFYEIVEKNGMFFPPHPGDESATIGGIIATNAGGSRALKYGVIRNFVRGIEAVFPDGSVEFIGGKFKKNSTGYSLINLIIGSEGTLGVITKATISLIPPPEKYLTLAVPYKELKDALGTLPVLFKKRILPMAVEFIESSVIEIVENYLNKNWPCEKGNFSLMIIIDGSEQEVLKTAEKIGEICLENGCIDVFVSESEEKQKQLLEMRSIVYEALKNYTVEILDITVPPSKIPDFILDVKSLEREINTFIPSYGHAGDGNVHNHIMKAKYENKKWIEIEKWREKIKLTRDRIHNLAKKHGGIISGEHGLGLVKKEYLPVFISEKQIEIMRKIKEIFDPAWILNPGKIFP